MDALNHFDTKTTNRLLRAEYLVGLIASFYLLFTHLSKIEWWDFAALFLYIDLIGYIPGAIAYRRSSTKRIPKHYYVLYNTMHSLVTQSAVALLWWLLGGPVWSLLALPIHLFGDRALFGNFLKPFGLPFEPVLHPGFDALRSEVTADSAGPVRAQHPVTS
ncbi:putative integral membrane protein [Streptomyces hygroscopicus subsp. jinggangensis 5008]|nr:putative integral membrane protein [Streptomyces hygroscopicus subsp. jinggangensis 5008]AGF59811.1 putative integral membrane protein [Streptomyces hygroscopicus subsp. jinggangensis TL01]